MKTIMTIFLNDILYPTIEKYFKILIDLIFILYQI